MDSFLNGVVGTKANFKSKRTYSRVDVKARALVQFYNLGFELYFNPIDQFDCKRK